MGKRLQVDALMLRGRHVLDLSRKCRRWWKWLFVWLRGDAGAIGLGRKLFGKTSVTVSHAQFRAMSQGRNANPLPVDIGAVGAREVMENEKSSLKDDLGVVAGHLGIAQNNIVPGVAPDRKRPVGLETITLLRTIEA